MCLVINNRKMRAESRVCYKVLRRVDLSLWIQNDEPHLRSFHKRYKWFPGVARSDRRRRELSSRERLTNTIQHGIHVFWTRADAQRRYPMTGHNFRLVPVTCFKKDLVTRGHGQMWSGAQEAVFTKVTLSKRAYDKAMKGKSPTV